MAKSRSPRNTRRQINAANVQPCAEVEIYIHLLLLVYLMDQNELLAAKKVRVLKILSIFKANILGIFSEKIIYIVPCFISAMKIYLQKIVRLSLLLLIVHTITD